MQGDVDKLIEKLSQTGLIPNEALQLLIERTPEELRPRSGGDLLALLEDNGLLTPWQVSQLAAENGRPLVLENYVLLDHIGAGGMGEVFKAEHRRMERIVALKLLHAGRIDTQETLERFFREVKAAARLVHPNIVTAYDADEAEGYHFLVMEYVEGCDLGTLAQHRRIEIVEAVGYIAQAARGLGYAHRQGIVHRDIKPGNLLLDRTGTVKILDMGIARLAPDARRRAADETETQLTEMGLVMGTVDFMAPEQAMSLRNADERSDIYSLGCTIYFLLAGKPAYEGRSVVEKLFAHRDTAVPSLRAARDDAPEALDELVERMMAKDPAERFQTMGEVLAALDGLGMLETVVGMTERITAALSPDELPPPDATSTTAFSAAAARTSSAAHAMTEPAPRTSHGRAADSPSLAATEMWSRPESPGRASSAPASSAPASQTDRVALERLQRFIEGCGGPDKFIDYEEEQSVFRHGGELGLSLAEVEALLEECCAAGGWTRQSKLTEELTRKLEDATRGDGAIGHDEYESIIDYAVSRRMPRKQAEEHCLTLILDHKWRPKQGLFDRWFMRKRKQYGLD